MYVVHTPTNPDEWDENQNGDVDINKQVQNKPTPRKGELCAVCYFILRMRHQHRQRTNLLAHYRDYVVFPWRICRISATKYKMNQGRLRFYMKGGRRFYLECSEIIPQTAAIHTHDSYVNMLQINIRT